MDCIKNPNSSEETSQEKRVYSGTIAKHNIYVNFKQENSRYDNWFAYRTLQAESTNMYY